MEPSSSNNPVNGSDFRGDPNHYREILHRGQQTAEAIRDIRSRGYTGKELLLALTQITVRSQFWKDYPYREVPLRLEGADLSGCAFACFGSIFREADLNKANLRSSFWFFGNLDKVTFSGSTMQDCEIQGVSVNGTTYSDTDLSRADLHFENPNPSEPLDFRRANLEDATIRCDVLKAHFAGAQMKGCCFKPATIGASLDRSFLAGLSEEQKGQIQVERSKNCFIATAACGTSQENTVIQLQAFRDRFLRRSLLGRCFISTYETFSPPLARWISRRAWARFLTRHLFVRPASACAELCLKGVRGLPSPDSPTLVAHLQQFDSMPDCEKTSGAVPAVNRQEQAQ